MGKFNVRFFWAWGLMVPALLVFDLVACIYLVAAAERFFGVR